MFAFFSTAHPFAQIRGPLFGPTQQCELVLYSNVVSRTGWAPPLARIYLQASAVSWCDRQTAWDSKKTFLTTWPLTNQQTHTQTNTRKSRNICSYPWHSAFRNVSMATSLPLIQNRQDSRPHNRQHEPAIVALCFVEESPC